ncbi:MAG TPA: TOBE domain-containing protein [Isosphaeraceae bacterium]|nr:TOBE domain-containing protein [Isosphaeraceae bacterium]
MRLSARNVLKGTVVKLVPGALNTEVVIKIDEGVEIVSMISKESATNLGLAVGGPAYAVIKASNVIVAVD